MPSVNGRELTNGEWNLLYCTNYQRKRANMDHIDGCRDPDCIICQWIRESVIRFYDGMKAAIAAVDMPPITYTSTALSR
jgi:hypothetical protein